MEVDSAVYWLVSLSYDDRGEVGSITPLRPTGASFVASDWDLFLGYTSEQIESLAVPIAEMTKSPLRVATGCDPSMPPPIWARQRKEGSPTEPEQIPRLTADWLLPQCASVPSALACLEQGGCRRSDGPANGCLMPCPTPPEPEPPESPLQPVLTPCPEGWREVLTEDGPDAVAVCEPWPATGHITCSAAEAHFVGEASCTRVGDACPASDFASFPQGIEVRYVDPDALPGGIGTEEQPFARIQDALLAVPENGVIALARGSFNEPLIIDRDVRLVGACVEATELRLDRHNELEVTSEATVAIENLRIYSDRPEGIVVHGTARLSGIVAEGSTTTSSLIVVAEGTLNASDLVLRGDARLYLLSVRVNGTAQIDRAVFEGGRRAGVSVSTSSAALSRVAVLDSPGYGILVSHGSQAEVSRSVVARFVRYGIEVDDDSFAQLSDVVIEDSQASGTEFKAGIYVRGGARVTGARVLVRRVHNAGVKVYGEGSSVLLSDLVVYGCLQRVTDQLYGRGLWVDYQGLAQIERALFSHNNHFTVTVHERGSQASLTDVTILDSQVERKEQTWDAGIEIEEAGLVLVERVVVRRAMRSGVLVFGHDSRLQGTDIAVFDSQPRTLDETLGRGFEVHYGGQVDLTRVLLSGNRNVAAFAYEIGTILSLTDVMVEETIRANCFGFACPSGGADGVVAGADGRIELERFRVSDNEHYGVHLSKGVIRLRDGIVSGNQVGIGIDEAGFDFEQIAQGVIVTDNRSGFVTE